MLQAAVTGLFTVGGAYAVCAVCLTLLYRTTGVISFAMCANGMIGTLLLSILVERGWPLGAAVAVAIAVSAAISVISGWTLTRLFFEASLAHRTAVAIALFTSTLAAAFWAFGTSPRSIPDPIGGDYVQISDVAISRSGILNVIFGLALAAIVTIVWQRTSVGRRLRAISQAPTAAELLGMRVRRLSIGLWAVTGALAAGAMILVAPNLTSDPAGLSFVVVPSLAAALVGRFRMFFVAAIGGLALAVLQSILETYEEFADYKGAVPFVVITAFLLWSERKEQWDSAR